MHCEGTLSADVKASLGSIGEMTQLTAVVCAYSGTTEQYTPIFGLPSLMQLHLRVKDSPPPDAEALRAQYAMLSRRLTGLAFMGGTQIMVRIFVIQGCGMVQSRWQGRSNFSIHMRCLHDNRRVHVLLIPEMSLVFAI